MDEATVASLLRRLTPLGYADILRAVGGGMASQIPAGYAGIGKLLGSGFDAGAAADTVERTKERIAPALAPRTPEGAENLQSLAGLAEEVPKTRLPSGYTIGETLAPAEARFEETATKHPVLGASALGLAAVFDPNKARMLSRGLRAAARNAAVPRAAGALAAQRGAISWEAPPKRVPDADWGDVDVSLPGPRQAELPGVAPRTAEQAAAQAQADALRRAADETPAVNRDVERMQQEAREAGEAIYRLRQQRPRGGSEPTATALAREAELYRLKNQAPEGAWPRALGLPEQRDIVDALGRQQDAAALQKARAEIAALQGQRTRVEPLEDALRREGDILRLKLDTPGLNVPQAQRQQQMDMVRELRRAAQQKATWTPEAPTIPNWAAKQTELPTTRGVQAGGTAPAGPDWWNKKFNINPDEPPASVAEFLRAVRDVPEAFQYGPMPKGAHSLEDFAEAFGQKAGKDINVKQTWESGSDYDEPYKIETEKTHGRYEVMRDVHGDYKYSDEPKVHESGDYPMYDESGNVKKKELFGPPLEDEGPLKVKRRAEYGDIKRDEYGNEKYPLAKSEGGEPMRDERGNIKYTKEENPDYSPPEDEDTTYLRVGNRPGEREIKITGYEGGEPTVYSMDADKEGALLYQTLFAHASQEGKRLGVEQLTPDNKYRMLSNALSNYARTGSNPRNVSMTASGARPAARGFAPGERIWQAETGESEARLGNRSADPDALRFTGSGFETRGGESISPQELAAQLKTYSPDVEGSKVGLKSLMRGAVYRWLETATPEQAAQAAKSWGKVGGPLFGFGASGVAATLAAQLRRDAHDTQ